MQLISQGVIPAANIIWRPGHGGFAFTVVCKATFELQAALSPLAKQQEPVIETDEWTETGSLLRATDLVPFKKRPEVLVVGDVHAPEGRPVTSLIARIAVGEIDKSILVVGDRYVTTDGRIGEPATFVRMPLVWERAVASRENPVGKPFGSTIRNPSPATSEWMLAPNFYTPALELPRPGSTLDSVGLAPISPLWPSRLGCLQQHAAGWDPLRWHERPLPTGIDLAYMNAAPADQQRTEPFADEMIYLDNLHPHGARLSTRLQPMTPIATVEQGAGHEPLKLRCDTLVIDTNRGLAMLVWRGLVVLDHPDRPGRVVVTWQEMPTAAAPVQHAPAQNEDDIDATITLTGDRKKAAIAALPFSKSAAPASFSQSSPPRIQIPKTSVAEEGHTLLPTPRAQSSPVLPFASSEPTERYKNTLESLSASDDDQTLIPMPFVQTGSVLPFPASKEQVPLRSDAPPFKPPIDAPAPVGLSAWTNLGSDSAASSSNVFTPPQAHPAPIAEAIQEAKSTPEPSDMEARLRLIQRAIWKGDRPIQQILAEHGLTEIEWRAAKRASTRKSNA